MRFLKDPEPTEAAAWLDRRLVGTIVRNETVLLIGRCTIDYSGRASSKLAAGDRIVLIKGDGTLLVHNPSGVKPVNWQPAGATFGVELEDATTLVVTASRRKPAERVRIAFQAIAMAAATRLVDDKSLRLVGSEFDLRDHLHANPALIEDGFSVWASERASDRGPMDLYGEDAKGRRVVVELKRTPAGIAQATQLWRYVEKERRRRGVAVRGILIAPSHSKRCVKLLAEHGLEAKVVSWKDVRPDDALGAAGQASLREWSSQTTKS